MSRKVATKNHSISVVIPAYGSSPHLEAVLTALMDSTDLAEQIFVSHSGKSDPAMRLGQMFPSVKFLHSKERLFAGAARNRAARLATGDVLAFCDDDAVPDRNWIANIRQHFLNDGTVLVGSIDTEREGGYWGMATWLCEFSEQTPWQSKRKQNGGASCNMAVRREDMERVGYFPEDFRAGQDTMVLHSLRSSGLTQIFDPAVRVGHFNISGFGHFRRHLFNQGRHFAKVRKTVRMSGHTAIRWWPLAPMLGLAKGWLIIKRLARSKRPFFLLKHLPGVLIGIIVWTSGTTYAAATNRFTGEY